MRCRGCCGKAARSTSRRSVAWRITPLGDARSRSAGSRAAPRRQAHALAALAASRGGRRACAALGIGRDTLDRLAAKGWIEAATGRRRRRRRSRPRPAASATHSGYAPELTADQRRVLTAIAPSARRGFRAYLLHGVTGSGKTEVYLRLIAAELAAGRQTLLLVPEIGLTPQLVARLARALRRRRSRSSTRRSRSASASRRGGGVSAATSQLVVGTRSAVFAPLPDSRASSSSTRSTTLLTSSRRGFRYSARDLAVVRARRARRPRAARAPRRRRSRAFTTRSKAVSQARACRGASARPAQPRIRVVDLNRHASRQALSTPLVAAIGQHLAAGNQVLLFLNRRGFAPALFCPGCKDAEQCSRCDARLTVHAAPGALRCHHCGAERPLAWACPPCGGERIRGRRGHAARRRRARGAVSAARASRGSIATSTSRKGALAAVLEDVASGRYRDPHRHADADEGPRLPARDAWSAC